MSTLVVSDLHLGARAGRDVLRDAGARACLTDALREVDRLVLLGDVLELRQGPVRDALAAADEPLRAIGAALPAGAEVVIVPGNHDHHLAEPWLQRRARKAPAPPLGLESAVDWRAGEPLATVARLLAPAHVRAAYPGVWLRPDVYAFHGHYGDRHTTVPMFERIAAGAMARIVREPARGPRCAEDYETVLAPVYAWIHAVAQGGGLEGPRRSDGTSAQAWRALRAAGGKRGLRRRALGAAFPALIWALNRAGLGPLRTDLSSKQLRRAPLIATSEVLRRLEVKAAYVLFGHTHRAGPLPADAGSEFSAPAGSALLNTGSWVREPQFVGRDPRTSPYRAGFAASLDADGPPRLRCLLDDLHSSR